MKRRTVKVIVVAAFAMLMLVPICALIVISKSEKAVYAPQDDIELKDVAYGEAKAIQYGTIGESVKLSGTVVSAEVDFIDVADGDNMRYVINAGDYVQEDTVIGYIGHSAVTAGKEGIVRDVGYGETILLDSVDKMALECYTDKKSADKLSVGEKLTNEDGEVFQVTEVAPVMSENGVKLKLLPKSKNAELVYGTELKDAWFNTPNKYDNVLIVDNDCVYSYPGKPEQYIRVVDSDLNFVEEIEVKAAFSDGKNISVSGDGVQEGLLCDSGYKSMVESTGQQEGVDVNE